MRPTAEQQQAVDAFKTGKDLKINAFAGTGKTSTLVILSKQHKGSGLYLAFNKSIVAEAKTRFSRNCTCMTINALALRSMPQNLRKIRNKMFGKINAIALAETLKLKDTILDSKIKLSAQTQAFLILQTVKAFTHGTLRHPEPINIAKYGNLARLSDKAASELSASTTKWASKTWERMISPKDVEIPLGFDGQVKLWALNEPKINFDYILLDEAQDTNPVVLQVLQNQRAQIVYVGDKYQQIYDWRGAVNAMEKIEGIKEVYLTKSFRFGVKIANTASKILRYLGEENTMKGNPAVQSKIGVCVPDAILTRTNSTVMSEVIASINAERRCHIIGGTQELKRLLKGVISLKENQPSDVPEFFGFCRWSEVIELVENGEGDHLMTLVNLVNIHGEKHLLWAINRVEYKEEDAELIISTVYKAKGREWDCVKVAEDFLPSAPADIEPSATKLDAAEVRVFYVAVTRGRKIVDVSKEKLSLFDGTQPMKSKTRQVRKNRYAKPVRLDGPTPLPAKSEPAAITLQKPIKRNTSLVSKKSKREKRELAMQDILDSLEF